MKQKPKPPSPALAPKLSALVCPACELCGQPTRFVGLESTGNDRADLCTYECDACGHTQTNVIERAGNGQVPPRRLQH
jgi:hypothetical protein